MSESLIRFTVYGDPKAQKRHRHYSRGGFVKIYDPSKVNKNDFMSVAQYNAPSEPFSTPLVVVLNFYFKRPKSHYRTGKFADKLKDSIPVGHSVKPDVDNTMKLCLDSLNKVFWKDDALITVLIGSKKYTDAQPRTEVFVAPLSDVIIDFNIKKKHE